MAKLENIGDFLSRDIDEDVVKELSRIRSSSSSLELSALQIADITTVITEHGGVKRDEWFMGILKVVQHARSIDPYSEDYLNLIVGDSLIGFLNEIDPELIDANTALTFVRNSANHLLLNRSELTYEKTFPGL